VDNRAFSFRPLATAGHAPRAVIALHFIDDATRRRSDRAHAGSDDRANRSAYNGSRRRAHGCAGGLLLCRASSG
jgi:hypothetical protein